MGFQTKPVYYQKEDVMKKNLIYFIVFYLLWSFGAYSNEVNQGLLGEIQILREENQVFRAVNQSLREEIEFLREANKGLLEVNQALRIINPNFNVDEFQEVLRQISEEVTPTNKTLKSAELKQETGDFIKYLIQSGKVNKETSASYYFKIKWKTI